VREKRVNVFGRVEEFLVGCRRQVENGEKVVVGVRK